MARAHVSAALKDAKLDGAIRTMSEEDALKGLLSGQVGAVVIDIQNPPLALASVPLDGLRMIPVFAPGL